MMVFKQMVLNGQLLKECPFQREFELQGYLIAHPELLSLAEDDDEFTVSELIGVERPCKNGRVDMVVEYGSGQIAIVELKRGEVGTADFEQVKGYLNDISAIRKWKAIEKYETLIDGKITKENMFGVLVGRSFSAEVMKLLTDKKTRRPIINGLTIKRYKANGNEYLITEHVSNFSIKDYSKYRVEAIGPLGKGRTVLEAIRTYVKKHSNISFSKLESKFPPELRGTNKRWGCISSFRDAKELADRTNRARHFLDNEDVIVLGDGTRVAVSSQWGIGNIGAFIKQALKNGVHIEEMKV